VVLLGWSLCSHRRMTPGTYDPQCEGVLDMDDQFPSGASVADVRARNEAELMRYPNVVGVADGVATRGGERTGEQCIVVYVSTKVPVGELAAEAVLPREIDGVRVDVVEVGRIEAQATD
jgi:hypothetical protein